MVVSRRVIGHGRGLEAPPRAWLLEVGSASWPGAGAATPTMWAIRPGSRTTSPCPSRTRLAATRSRSARARLRAVPRPGSSTRTTAPEGERVACLRHV